MLQRSATTFFMKAEEKRLFHRRHLNIYPTGSQSTCIYGLPKMHTFFVNDYHQSFRPIVSSIGTYNYNQAKFLCKLLSPLLSMYSCEDSFSFIKEAGKLFSQIYVIS